MAVAKISLVTDSIYTWQAISLSSKRHNNFSDTLVFFWPKFFSFFNAKQKIFAFFINIFFAVFKRFLTLINVTYWEKRDLAKQKNDGGNKCMSFLGQCRFLTMLWKANQFVYPRNKRDRDFFPLVSQGFFLGSHFFLFSCPLAFQDLPEWLPFLCI